MLKKWLAIFLIVFATTLSFAKTVAVVGNTQIDSSELDKQVKLIISNSKGTIKDSKQLRDDVLQKMISQKLIVLEAKRLKLDKSKPYLDAVNQAKLAAEKSGATKKASFNKDFESYKEVLLADAYGIDFINKNKISDNEAKVIYDGMVKFYRGSKEIKIGEISTANESNARKAILELDKGVAFTTVANKYTIDRNLKKNGGVYQNYVNLNDMKVAAPQYYNHVKDLKKGQYTKRPIKSDNGYLIISVQDLKEANIPSFNVVKDSIKNDLIQSKLQKEFQRLYKVNKVKIY